MPKDDIFNDRIKEDFQFNERVAEVFDDMLDRSVPCYRQVIDMTGRILAKFLHPQDEVYDLGCSTGSTLIELARKLEPLQLHYTGTDNSSAMIEKAKLKAEMYTKKDKINFVENDITDLQIQNGGAILLNYTMQFIRPILRRDFLARVYSFLRPGGVIIMSEKVISHDPLLNRKFIECYHQFKKEQGYSEMEISRKREALENVLIPFSIDENRQMLEQAGFANIETFFQWFNFVSFVGVKE